MELSRILIENFKRIKRVPLDLAPVNVLVGANGSGKSSIIQAVHLACCVIRQAGRIDSAKTATVGADELDYLPTDDYKTLGHSVNWGNKSGTPATRVQLDFAKADGSVITASCALRSARNAGISITGEVHSELRSLLRVNKKFYSAYIPGISGIPNKEDRRSKKVILKACSYGDSNVILRNALLLLKESDPGSIEKIQEWIGIIADPIDISVEHNADSDLDISCNLTTHGEQKSIELAGTGYIQLIQIFCYILLFKPGILLIDEPDIHLHPNVQEGLVRTLSKIAKERSMKIVLTTHSPFILRGAPPDTNVVWLKDGKVESNDRHALEMSLGWGAFGKKIILISEDSSTISMLRLIIAQWPGISRAVAIHPGTGYKNLPKPEAAAELSKTLGNHFKIVIHRDRDSLTDYEASVLKASYAAHDVHLWLPVESDIEAYFCTPAIISITSGLALAESEELLARSIAKNEVRIKQQFIKQRKAHQDEMYPQGGSPTNDEVWASFQDRPLRGAKGKIVFNELKNLTSQKHAEEHLEKVTSETKVAPDLKDLLESLLA
jgi:ABC-type branched-subunit amino acid transport system ATPase component